jgi:hypothetical protein
MQPTTDVRLPDRVGLSCQKQKGGLEGVFGILLVAEQAPAQTQHHRPMPADEEAKHRLVAPGCEATQKLPIAPLLERACGCQLARVPQQVR